MKILHINTADQGGAATGMLRQHASLLEHGLDSKVLIGFQQKKPLHNVFTHHRPPAKHFITRCFNKFNLLKSEFERECEKIGRLGRPYYMGGSFELFSSPFSPYQLHRHPLVKEADIINLHWTSGFLDIPSFLKNVNKPIVWTLHDMNPYLGGFHYDIDQVNNPKLLELNQHYLNIKSNAFLEVEKYAVVGNSNWNALQAVKSKIFRNASLVETIYYPMKENQYNPINKKLAQNALNLPRRKFIIGFASENLSNPRKGFADLLEAIKCLPANYKKKIHCLAFGESTSAVRHDIEISFTQMGAISNSHLQSIVYSAMDVFIIPSLAEAFGLTALEAMACKTPVIGYDTGGIPEMVKNNMTGFLAEKGNVNSLSKRISDMMDTNSREREYLEDNAYNVVATQHNQFEIAKQYKKVYQSLI